MPQLAEKIPTESQQMMQEDSLVTSVNLVTAGAGALGGGLAVTAAVIAAPMLAPIGLFVALCGAVIKIVDVCFHRSKTHSS